MNEILQSLYARKSVRVFEEKAIPAEMKQSILEAAAQAPSAGCQQLYTILDITDQTLKDALADRCDHQPFIAKAPLVLVFGWPTQQQKDRAKPQRCAMEHIVHENGYRSMDGAELREMFGYKAAAVSFDQWCTAFHNRKYDSAFAREMSRSVAEYLEQYK